MTIQGSTQIGDVIRKGVAFNARNWTGDAMNSDSLIQSVQDFFAILEQRKIEYVLVGGIALLHYVEGRNTQDLDLLMTVSALRKLPELEIIHQDMYFARARYGGLEIDLLLTKNPLFATVHKQYARVQEFLGKSVRLATVEGLLLLKLYALPSLYRQGNFARVGIYENDIATLVHYYQPDMNALLDVLAKYVSKTDFEEITNILTDIQTRIQRFRSVKNE